MYNTNKNQYKLRGNNQSLEDREITPVYEPRQPKFRISRQSPEEIESQRKQHGMRYPKWWGDMSEEKHKKEEPSQGHEQLQNIRQPSFADSRVENNQPQAQPQSRDFKEDQALTMLRGEREKYLRDKRMETVPKPAETDHSHSTIPLKSVMRNSEGVKSKGGLALHYNMQDLCSHRPIEEDRPISPGQSPSFAPSTEDRRGRATQKKPSRGKQNQSLHQTGYPRPKSTTCTSKPQNVQIKELIRRDKQIAIDRRERVESSRNKRRQEGRALEHKTTLRTHDLGSSSSGSAKLKQRSLGNANNRDSSPGAARTR